MGVRLWTRDQIAQGILAGDALLIYRGDVVRVPLAWLDAHPGGSLAILHFVGRDATDEVDAFHAEPALRKLRAFTIGRLADDELPWKPLVPPVASGWVRREGRDGKLEWHSDAHAVRSAVDTESSPAAQILLVPNQEGRPPPARAPTLDTITPGPTHLSLEEQAKHSEAYKELHRQVIDAGLYNPPFLAGYGPDLVRYVLLGAVAAAAYTKGYFFLSALFLGFFWQQLTFLAHDLGHMGVTASWTLDRIIGILVADFVGGLSIGWWVDNHNIHHLVTNHPSHDPDIEHLPFFAITTAFFDSLYSSYYKKVFPFDAASRLFVSFQHKLFYVVLGLARFNLYANSYGFLARKAFEPMRARYARAAWALEILGLVVFWSWFGALLRGLPTWGAALQYLLVSHVAASPVHVQIVLSHFSRSTADLGAAESFPARQLRTTTDVVCPPALAFVHGGLHLQVTHHLFPRLPRHNLARASQLVKRFAAARGLEYAEFGFAEGNAEIRGVLRAVADQVGVVGMVAREEVRDAVARSKVE